MPSYIEQTTPGDGSVTSYWLQALQAGHWRNLEKIADAAPAMIRTGTLAQEHRFDAVRLLEARFDPRKGQTAFFEIAAIDISGARFAGSTGNAAPDHARMDLAGGIAPLLPASPVLAAPAFAPGSDAGPDTDSITGIAAAAAPETEQKPLRDDMRQTLGAPLLSHADSRFQSVTRRDIPTSRAPHGDGSQRGTRSRLMAGVMVGAFAVGVAVSALAPEQSGRIAAAIYEKMEIGTAGPLAQAPAPHPALEKTAAAPEVTADRDWPVAWTQTVQAEPQGEPAIAAAPTPDDKFRPPRFPATHAAAPSGQDLEAESRGPGTNLLAANLASPAQPVALQGSTEQKAPVREPSPPAVLTVEEAYAMQASLPVPTENYEAPVVLAQATPAKDASVRVAQGQDRVDLPADGQAEDQGLRLTATAPSLSGQGAAFTTAVAGDAGQLEMVAAFPRPQRKPAALKQRAAFRAALADTIENGSVEDMLQLISPPAESVAVASLTDVPADARPVSARADLTDLLDFALLQGRPDHAMALVAKGATPSDGILNVLKRAAAPADLERIAPIVRKAGIDPNRVSDTGMTPLMQAAYIGDARAVDALLILGADPAYATGEGLRAADFAARSKHVAVQEKLVLAADQTLYTPLMFGLNWSDTLETVQARSSVCKQVGEGFVACSLKTESWLDDTAAVIAQFDTRNGNRLVAIQVDSRLYNDADDAEVGFKKAAQLIAKVVPPDQFGFPVRDIPADVPVFESLTPNVGTGQYFQYWPDDNLSRPVYVHMKMIGYKRDRGFHRIVIGNPFRVG